MPTLKEIRRRIQSIDKIHQITKSMEMIAAARFQRANLKALNSNKYMTALRNVVAHLVNANIDKKSLWVNPGKEGAKTAVVVVGADRGLCGSYNSNIFLHTDNFLKSFSPDNVDLILLGRRIIDYYSNKKWTVISHFAEWSNHVNIEQAEKIANVLIEKFFSGIYAKVQIIYTEHLTIFTRRVVNTQLLPIEKIEAKDNHLQQDPILEPNAEELFLKLIPQYFVAEINNVLNQAYTSELAARVCAMRSATKNAEEVKDKLTLTRNKLRQTSITKEVLEISSGAEAMQKGIL